MYTVLNYIWPFEGNYKVDVAPDENEFDTPVLDSINLTLFSLPQRYPESPLHPNYRPTQAAFAYEWLVLAHASQLPKSYQISKNWPQ